MSTTEAPKRIYKYVTFDIAKIIIKTRAIKFSRPNEFNDPFDCDIDLIDFNFTPDLSEKVQTEMEQLKEMFKASPGFSKLSRDNSFWERGYRETQIQKINSCRISCFSLLNNSILMWSHYANKHFGMALEFDNTISPRFENLDDKKDVSEAEVGYSDYEKINYLSEDRKYAIYKLFLSKSISWAHEKEYRMILLGNKAELQKFNDKFLKAVYFGLRAKDNEIDDIISLCRLHGFIDLDFFKCKKDNLSINFTKLEKL